MAVVPSHDAVLIIADGDGTDVNLTSYFTNITISETPVLTDVGGINDGTAVLQEQGGAAQTISGDLNMSTTGLNFFVDWRTGTQRGTTRAVKAYPAGTDTGNRLLSGSALITGTLDFTSARQNQGTQRVVIHVNSPVWSTI